MNNLLLLYFLSHIVADDNGWNIRVLEFDEKHWKMIPTLYKDGPRRPNSLWNRIFYRLLCE